MSEAISNTAIIMSPPEADVIISKELFTEIAIQKEAGAFTPASKIS